MTSSEYRPIPGYPGYSINAKGVIFCEERTLMSINGWRTYPTRVICHQRRSTGLQVTLRDDSSKLRTVSVALVLLETWGDEPKPASDEPLYCGKKDGDVHSLELSNLTWMSRGKIKQLANANGRNK